MAKEALEPTNAFGKPLFPEKLIMVACDECDIAMPWPLRCGHDYAEIYSREYSRVSAPTVAPKEKLPDDYICIAPQEQALVINRLRGAGSKEDNRQAELHEKLCLRCQELVAECERREVAPIVAPEVDEPGDAEVARFTAEDMYSALDDYCDCTTNENENQEVRATITSFLSWFEENTHEPTDEELEEYYKSIAAPYGGAL